MSDAIGTIASSKKTTGLQILGNDGTNSYAPKIDSTGNVSVQLSGRKIDVLKNIVYPENQLLLSNEYVYFLATTQTTSPAGEGISVSTYPRRYIQINNVHNKSIKCKLCAIMGANYGSPSLTIVNDVVIAAGASLSINSTIYPLINEPFTHIYIILHHDNPVDPPTTGSIYLHVIGGVS